jgi:GT2 family glycosyltransferase
MTAVPPRASIVIVTYGQRALTEACLRSLETAFGHELGRGVEVIVVDNASPDDTLALLRTWEDRITVLAQPENHNFAGGCNIGARAARGEVLIFLNNDTVVTGEALDELAETVREPGVGAAGLRLLYPDGSLQHGGFHMVLHPYEGPHPLPSHFLYGHDGEHPAGRAVYEMDCVTGACLAMPRAVFEEVGGFDEEFVNGCEDVDLCFKVRASGRTIVYRGDLTV